MKKNKTRNQQKPELAVKGIPTSPGIAIGPVFVYSEPTQNPEMRTVPEKHVSQEIKRFKKAVRDSRDYLNSIYQEAIKSDGKEFAEILQTQIAILDDKIFLEEVEQLIRKEKYDAAYATYRVFKNKKDHFLNLSNEYFRDRAFDVQNLKRLVLKRMFGKKLNINLKYRAIIAADNLSPADTLRLHHKHILGFCTNAGGKNSHTAIVARSLGVPAVVGAEFITNVIQPDDQLVLDGHEGIIIINPGKETIQAYKQKQKNFLIIEKDLLKKADQPAQTTDGHRIEVLANIEFEEELGQMTKSGAEGIGLYRTEGLYLGGDGLPTENEQTENYLKIARAIQPQIFVVRTLDIGGDKILPDFVGMPEHNPFLGWRAIRFCLDHKEIFLPQLKAILRANVYGNIHIMLPMVSSLEEIDQVKQVLEEAKEILVSEGKDFNPKVKVGMMVEIPSAAMMAEDFAGEIDFFSIGTNDLVQYTLAVDRANEQISHLYNHFHPALLQLIDHVIKVGREKKKPVSMCGEMAGDPVAIPLLVGMGLKHFSAAHIVVPEIKNLIRNVSFEACQELYGQVKNLKTATQIQKVCEDFYGNIFTVPANSEKNAADETE